MVKGFKVLVITAWFISLFSIVQLSSPAGTSAQEKTSGGVSTRDAVDLGAMTVTAEKQEENVQDVSTSITVMDILDIEDRNIESVSEVLDFTPNMISFKDHYGLSNSISARGISAPLSTRGASSVGMYIDGVPVLSSFGMEEGLIDVERIEVLRGPQGTLYGKNTEVGAINIISRQPDNQFTARVSTEVGQWLSSDSGDKMVGGASLGASGPILKDKLFFEMAGSYKHKDGYLHNTYSDDSEFERENYFGRLKLRWMPTERLDMSLILSSIRYELDGDINWYLSDIGAGYFGSATPSRGQVESEFEGWQETKSQTQSLKLSYALTDTIDFTSITSIKETTLENAFDYDLTSAHIMNGYWDPFSSEKISQEIRLDSTSNRLNWVAGVYYDTDDTEIRYSQNSMYPSMFYNLNADQTGDAYAIFGQVGYFLTEKFKLIGGLRYDHQDSEMERCLPIQGTIEDSWERLTPKITAEYHATPDMLLYADVSEGFRTGGFNGLATDPDYYSFDEESLWSYELGMKSLFMNKRIMLNAALFYMEISDMQVDEWVNLNTAVITNAAEATSWGLELDVTARITDTLTLMGGFGYTNVEFDEFSDAGGDYSGNKNPFAPNYTFNVGLQYRNTKGYFARIDLIGYGKTYYDKANEYSRDPYEVVNAKIGYETDRFDIYLYGKNIFNQEYDIPYTSGMYMLQSEPGEVGLQIVSRF